MAHYALIFRATRPFLPTEQEQRLNDIANWVKQVTEMGIMLDPRNFGETAASFAEDQGEIVSAKEAGNSALSTIVYFDTEDRALAVDIARIHPGLRYGATVELREWTSPRAVLGQ